MADQHRQISKPDHLQAGHHPRQARLPAPGQDPGPGPDPAVVVSESILAIAAIADMARLIDPPGAARRPGRAVRRSRAATRSGPARSRGNPIDVLRCRIVWRLVAQLFSMASERDMPELPGRLRPRCHLRQLSMYLSHVVLSVPYATVATAFGRDRTTVVHACAVVEDRRDDSGYDSFVEQCERCIEAVFAPFGLDHADL